MAEKVIYNCHNHLSADKRVPSGYYPYFLVPAARNRLFRAVLSGALKAIVSWSKNDKVHRYAAFLKATYRKSQRENLPMLDVLLEQPAILAHTLFGFDFYMVESEKYSEKRLSVDLRHRLREEKFWTIADENPRAFSAFADRRECATFTATP